MRLLRQIGLGVLALGLACSTASAGTFTFVTAPGATEPQGGNPVAASTTIVTGNGTVSIVLTNLLADPNTVAQNLSDIFFTLSGGNTAGTTINSSSGQEVTVNSDGSFSLGATVAPCWNLDLSGASASGGTIHICDIGPGCTGPFTPAHTIIGAPNSGTATYAAAGGSIAGNGPHNPFLNQTATWTLNVAGVNADTRVTSAIFSFGTTAGDNVPGCTAGAGCGSTVPEPASLTLFGTGLAYLARWRRRKAA